MQVVRRPTGNTSRMDDDAASREQSPRRLRAAQDRARDLQAEVARVAGDIADTGERAGEVLHEAARAHPDRAEHLEAMTARARALATQQRPAGRER